MPIYNADSIGVIIFIPHFVSHNVALRRNVFLQIRKHTIDISSAV